MSGIYCIEPRLMQLGSQFYFVTGYSKQGDKVIAEASSNRHDVDSFYIKEQLGKQLKEGIK